MTQDLFKKVCPRVTTRADTYRVLSEGIFPSTGARARIQAVLRLDGYSIDILSYREDL
jgi:hypothetical protein